MQVICVDDNRIIRSRMVAYVRDLLPTADVRDFDNAERAVSFAKENGCDVLLTEIEIYGAPSGIDLARDVQSLNPRVNIIFTTVCSQQEYAGEVMALRPSAYLTKVVTRQDVSGALNNLLYGGV